MATRDIHGADNDDVRTLVRSVISSISPKRNPMEATKVV